MKTKQMTDYLFELIILVVLEHIPNMELTCFFQKPELLLSSTSFNPGQRDKPLVARVKTDVLSFLLNDLSLYIKH